MWAWRSAKLLKNQGTSSLKVKLKSKPYDPKKSCWVPEKGTGGYLEGLIESVDGGKVSVKLNESKEVS